MQGKVVSISGVPVSRKTGRPYPAGWRTEEKMAIYDQRVPANAPGLDLPAPEYRTLWWLQTDVLDGVITDEDWADLAEDTTWWDWTMTIARKAETFDNLKERMSAAVKAQLRKIRSKLNA